MTVKVYEYIGTAVGIVSGSRFGYEWLKFSAWNYFQEMEISLLFC